jgi:hypothetical protein
LAVGDADLRSRISGEEDVVSRPEHLLQSQSVSVAQLFVKQSDTRRSQPSIPNSIVGQLTHASLCVAHYQPAAQTLVLRHFAETMLPMQHLRPTKGPKLSGTRGPGSGSGSGSGSEGEGQGESRVDGGHVDPCDDDTDRAAGGSWFRFRVCGEYILQTPQTLTP